MLKTLKIKDFIIIDELSIEFDKGFNVITGETGAGKSIIINAIDLAFGARAGKDLIKSNANKASIELVLLISSDSLFNFYEKYGIDSLGDEVIVSREITETGSRSRINGVLVTQDTVKALREVVIDINNQHDTYTYIQPKYHISLLDSYGDNIHISLLSEYKNFYAKYLETLSKLENLQSLSTQSQQHVEFLKYQIDEIEAADIQDVDEYENLVDELTVLSNVERLKELSYSSYWTLSGEDGSVLDAIGKVKTLISKALEFDVSLASNEELIINIQENLKELSSNLRNYSEAMDLDEKRLDEVQERISLLDGIKRKFGKTLQDVLDTYSKLCDEYNSIEFSQEQLDYLKNEKIRLENLLTQTAEKLTASRKNLATLLSELIQKELEMLDMPKVQFKIQVQSCDFNVNGTDDVEFLISTNISETPKPLAKIASGGEISRTMLAIKTVFAKSDNINTIIFDEIDTGISGNACQAVAQSIKKLANSHQIISITHQPIIAAKSDRHFYVAKSQEDTTKVKVYTLNDENKVKAIALLAAGDVNDESITFAKQLIYS